MDARALKDKATELFSRGKFAKAAETYEQYCKADPKDLQARLRMGDAWAKCGKKDKAIVAYQAAAEGFARDGFLPRAIAASKLVLELDPGHKGVSQMLADLYARKSGSSRPSTARTLGAKPDPLPEKPATPAAAPQPAVEVAIEDSVDVPIDVEPPPPAAPPAPAPAIEIELDAAPTTGEIEVPIVGVEVPAASGLPAPGELPAELELTPAPPTYELEVEEPATALEAIGAEAELVRSAAVVSAPVEAAPRPEALESIDPEPEFAPVASIEPGQLESIDPEPESAPPASIEPAALEPLGLRPQAAPVELASGPEAIDPLPAAPESIEPEPEALDPSPIDDVVVLTKKRPPARVATPIESPRAQPTPAPVASSPSQAGAPPGLKPRRPDAPPAAAPVSSPSGARIWLPPGFQAPTPGRAPETVSAGPSSKAPPPAVAQTELERSLEVFTQFDVDAPVATPVVASAAAPAVASFTELELEGDSLLQAVEAAAAHGQVSSSGSVSISAEEVMEAPEERPDPGALPKIPLFSDLPEDAFIALFERCPLRRAEPGDRIIEQGSHGTSFFVICAGRARVVRTDGEASRELAMLEEGAFFGEMALLSDEPRSASVEAAAEDTQLLEIPALVLTELSSSYPTVATALKKFCRQRLLSNLMNGAALFKPFTRSERRDLIQRFRARDAAPGEILIKEGQPSDGLYVVLTGEVSVLVGQRQVATLKEGQVFGEMSLLTRSVTTATVKTTRRTSFLRLPKEDFDQLIMSHPQILEQVAELTDERRRQNAALQVRPDATASMV